MATVKKLSSNYIIQTPLNAASNITLDTDNVYVTGNLFIQGNTTTVASNNLTITDNVIVLNQGQPGAGITKGNAGIMIDRGLHPWAQLQFNQSGGNVWQITSNAAAGWSNILTSGVGITAVVDDTKPVLGGNLNVTGKTIYANVAAGTYLTLQGALELKSANVTPSVATGSTIFYAADTGAGQAGVFVVNPASTNEELVTKRRAFGFSLIL
jgi:lipopolysaccharide export system protein LptA